MPTDINLSSRPMSREERRKLAQKTINTVIPKLLTSDTKARNGMNRAHLISNPLEAKSHHINSKRKIPAGKVASDEKTLASSVAPQNTGVLRDAILNITIRIADTLVAARDLTSDPVRQNRRINVAVLNMASPLRPGGGFLSGASSQEESLCSRTTLLPSLKESWYRLPEYGGIWSPDVHVFKIALDEDLAKQDRFYVDVISAAMIRFPEVTERGDQKDYAYEKDREAAGKKIKSVLSILESKGTEIVILGAWGCGAYGNPVGEIARIWRRALLSEGGKRSKNNDNAGGSFGLDKNTLKRVVFAINDRNMAQDFSLASGFAIETV
jgi:uncharacterized protein (TIGR02452 family)